jgi:hypothetical protein
MESNRTIEICVILFEKNVLRWVSKVMRQHKSNFSNSPLNNSGEVSGFSGELWESLSPQIAIGASLLRPTSVFNRPLIFLRASGRRLAK